MHSYSKRYSNEAEAAFQSQTALVEMMHSSGLYMEHIGKDCVYQLRNSQIISSQESQGSHHLRKI